MRTPYDWAAEPEPSAYTTLSLLLRHTQLMHLELMQVRRAIQVNTITRYYIEELRNAKPFEVKKKREQIEGIILGQVTEQATVSQQIAHLAELIGEAVKEANDGGDQDADGPDV